VGAGTAREVAAPDRPLGGGGVARGPLGSRR
jgi:hypothetical protein